MIHDYADSEDFARHVRWLTREQLENLLDDHTIPMEDFDREFPISDTYETRNVLAWLGY